jgi:hypothetical protein
MNGSSGIVPTVDLATNNNNGYAYPVMPFMGGYGNGGFGGYGSDLIWLIVLFALFGGNWGNNGNGGFFGGRSFDDGYAWLSNGQKEIMQNTNNGFNTLQLSNDISDVKNGITGLSSQLCNSTYTLNDSIKDGFYGLNTSFLNCCCENRLATQDLKATVISENCADREALSNGIRDIIASQTAGTQRILDQLCQDKIDAKNDKIVDLQRELLMKDLQASQIAQTATLRAGQEREVDALYERLKNCPVGTTPVYGNQPIFTCPNNLGAGCGCGFNTTSQFI